MRKLSLHQTVPILLIVSIITGGFSACGSKPDGPVAVAVALPAAAPSYPPLEWLPVPEPINEALLPGITLSSASYATWLLPGASGQPVGLTVLTEQPSSLPDALENLEYQLKSIDYGLDFAVVVDAGNDTLIIRRVWQNGNTIAVTADVLATPPELLGGKACYILRMGRGLLPPFGEIKFKLVDIDGRERAGASVLLNRDKMTPEALEARTKALDYISIQNGVPAESLLTTQQWSFNDRVNKQPVQVIMTVATRPSMPSYGVFIDSGGRILTGEQYAEDEYKRYAAKYGKYKFDAAFYDFLDARASGEKVWVVVYVKPLEGNADLKTARQNNENTLDKYTSIIKSNGVEIFGRQNAIPKNEADLAPGRLAESLTWPSMIMAKLPKEVILQLGQMPEVTLIFPSTPNSAYIP